MGARIGGIVAVALAATATSGAAQQAEPELKFERVEITGSNIRRVDAETGLPVQIITHEEIERGGIMDPKDLLDRISAIQSFGSFSESNGVGNTEEGHTSASLRGLGAGRTLILLNGRRIAPYALGNGWSVDISGIPASAIERVEVLKDGASAVYGTDAIGGVINFILRKDYQGIEAGSTYLATEHGGGNNWRATLTAGWGNLAKDRFNAFVNLDYIRQDALRAADRSFSRTAYLPEVGLNFTSGNSMPANIRQPGGFGTIGGRPVNPTIPLTGPTADSCWPPYSFPTVQSPRACNFDYAAMIDNIPRSDKTTAIGRMTWQFSPDHQFFVEASYYRGEYLYKVAPTPLNANFMLTAPTLPPTSPYYPAAFVASLPNGNPNLPLLLQYRTVELGPRTDRPIIDEWRAVFGLKGTLRDWDYQWTAGYTSNKEVVNYAGGWLDETKFGPLLRSGVVNPFGPNTPEILQQMRATEIHGPVSDNLANDYGVELKASRPVWDLPAGSLMAAFGLEARREGLEQVNAEVLYTGAVIGGSGPWPSFTERRRSVFSAFAEADVPLTKGLVANFAVRHDHYSDFGGTSNPKLTLRWQARRDLVLRGSVGTGFRAPALFDIFVPNTFAAIRGFDDPLRCPVTHADADCQSGSEYHAKLGSNPNLEPETSRQLNLGLVAEPSKHLSLTIDYYQVRIENLITVVPLDAIFGDYARWAPTLVVRKAPDAQFPNLPGPIDYIVQTPVNAGQKRTSGVDLDLRYRLPSSGSGRWAVMLNGTYLLTYKASEFEQVSPGKADDAYGYGALPRWRHYATVDWSRGDWGATLAHTYQTSYSEIDLTTCDSSGVCSGRRQVGSNSIIDLLVRYEGVRHLKLQFGVRNLFDRAPPSAYRTGGFQIGYDPTYADPRGRMYFGSLRWTLP